MSKYIDAEKLIAEIEKEKKNLSNQDFGERCAIIAYDVVLSFIKSLQQEQPEVDLEEEIDRFLKSEESTTYENAGSYKIAVKDPRKIARHFYELGLNARKEE